MGRCEKWAITWSHFGDTQYGGKNEENTWKKAIKLNIPFRTTKYEKKMLKLISMVQTFLSFLFTLVASAQEYGQSSKYRGGLAVQVSEIAGLIFFIGDRKHYLFLLKQVDSNMGCFISNWWVARHNY